MSILFGVASSLPPGYIGDPYAADDISKFYDLNWPDHAGMLGQGYSSPGLSGLGQDDSTDDLDLTNLAGSYNPTPTLDLTYTPSTTTTTTGSSTESLTGALSFLTPSSPSDAAVITALQSGSNSVNLTAAQTSALTSSLTPTQQAQLIAAIGNSTVSLIRTASGGPYQVAGTNLVYNPATGQLSSSTTAVASGLTSALSASTLSSYLPLIGVAVVAYLLISSVGKK